MSEPLAEDRDAPGPDKQSEDDQHDPEHEVAADGNDDAGDHEDHGEDPEQGHGPTVPPPLSVEALGHWARLYRGALPIGIIPCLHRTIDRVHHLDGRITCSHCLSIIDMGPPVPPTPDEWPEVPYDGS